MHSFYIGVVLHLLVASSAFAAESKAEKDDKMLIMLEFEPIRSEDRSKRSSVAEGVRQERQSPEVPPEYLNLLQQLAVQQQQQQQLQPKQQQASATAQQPQQQLIQQLVVSRDGVRQPTAARYILSQDGRLLEESVGLSALGQGQQLASPFGLPVYQQDPLQSTQPQTLPPAPSTPRPPRPPVSEYTRQQQRLLQEYREAPLRMQIAGISTRQPPRPAQPVPTGPNSQSAQIFTPTDAQQRQQQQQQQFVLPPQFQDPQNPGIVYTPVPVDPQTYYQQQFSQQQLTQQQLAQQQLAQQQIAAQYAAEADPRQFYAQAAAAAAPSAAAPPQRPGPVSQQIIYQQPIPQEIPQDKIRRPINVLPGPAGAQQPQIVPQNLPQQYLIETTRPAGSQPPQYVSSDVSPQIQYVQQPIQQPQQPTPVRQQQEVRPQSTLLQPVAGRGLFTPIKPSRSSIYVSRSSTPKSLSLTITDDISSEKVPVVRLPQPAAQRPLTKQELDALVSAGYTVTPVQDPQFFKSKRQQPILETGRNHVVYENHQDGVQYQYSPGSSDPTATVKSKKSAPNREYFEHVYKLEAEKEGDKKVVPYVLALGKESS